MPPNTSGPVSPTSGSTARRHPSGFARADGSHARLVASEGYRPALSPDSRRLAYVLPRKKYSPRFAPVRLVDLVSGSSRLVGAVGGLLWSPDSRRLAVTDRHGLSLFDAQSGRRRVLVRGSNAFPGSFSPDGGALAYSVDNGGVGRGYRSDAFVVRLEDGAIRQLTHDGHSNSPTWGGDWIAYRSFHFSNGWSIGEIRVVRADGTGDHLIAKGHDNVSRAEQGIDPVQLSADGRRLVACLAFEFGCPPAAFTIPRGRRVALS